MPTSNERPKNLNFLLEPKTKEEQAQSAERLAQWGIDSLGLLDALVALRQVEEILGMARQRLHDLALDAYGQGDHSAFGAKIRISEIIDKSKIPQLEDLLKERKAQTQVLQKHFKEREHTLLSSLSWIPKKRQLAVYFSGGTTPRRTEVESDTD